MGLSRGQRVEGGECEGPKTREWAPRLKHNPQMLACVVGPSVKKSQWSSPSPSYLGARQLLGMQGACVSSIQCIAHSCLGSVAKEGCSTTESICYSGCWKYFCAIACCFTCIHGSVVTAETLEWLLCPVRIARPCAVHSPTHISWTEQDLNWTRLERWRLATNATSQRHRQRVRSLRSGATADTPGWFTPPDGWSVSGVTP